MHFGNELRNDVLLLLDGSNMPKSEPYQKCWANSLGDCGGPMSAEHIFSKAIGRKGPKTELSVKGMANMPDQSIGFDWPKARILCARHNSILSPLDSEAQKLAEALHRFVDRTPQTTVHLNGPLLERWTIKTVINFMAAGFAHNDKWLPDDNLTRIAFGLNPLPDECGLYFLRVDGYTPISTEQAGITPAWAGQVDGRPTDCMGAVVYLHGATFFLLLNRYFLDVLRDNRLNLMESSFPLTFDRLRYHPASAQLDDNQGHTLLVQFDWD
ncbi:MAG: hypothetical protein IE913_12275 [Halothiobacillus sp.]|nr:hypothetical protein [Halothiobacillus sp.]